MIFLASVLFVFLLFVLPGELPLVWLAAAVADSGPAQWGSLAALNLAIFALLFVFVRFGSIALFDLGWEKGRLTRRLAEYLDVTGWRWINLLGLAGVALGASVLALTGRLPYPVWFLFAAIAAGLLDLIGNREIVKLPKLRPQPRFTPEPLPEPEVEPAGKSLRFTWEFYRSGAGGSVEEKTQEFVLSEEECQQARKVERYPRRPIKEYVKYVRKGFPVSVQRIAAYFREESTSHDYSPIEEAMDIVGFTRAIVYKGDEETRGVADYANFPIETLYDQAGDCEDHAILAAVLLHNLGHDVGLFHLDLGDSGHLALAYRPPCSSLIPSGPFCATADNGKEYYYVETVPTESDRGVGEIAESFLENIREQSVVAVG